MKKKNIANLLLVLTCLAIVVTGVGMALKLRSQEQESIGTQFQVTALPEDGLTAPEAENVCTVTLRCDTILENTEMLDPAKAPYTPADGVILPVTTVSFTTGETVFDILKRVCDAAEIPLEYSWNPLYDSYYVEGIQHLYEFDCGPESGWMYQVNGVFPNYGCSAYEVRDGDAIVWAYTCAGLGEDLGAESWKEGGA